MAIAGLVFGEEAASGAVSAQLSGLMGRQSADLLQTAIQNASGKLSGTLATLVGIVALVITASGVFTEMQQTLNVIWRARPDAALCLPCCALVPRAWDWWLRWVFCCWCPW